MYYADFEKLKIIKDYHVETFNFELPNLSDLSIKNIKELCDEGLKGILDLKGNLTAQIEVVIRPNNIYEKDASATEEEAEDFSSWTNVIIASVFKYLSTSEYRKREGRLDAPDKLKGLNCTFMWIKNAANTVLLRDRFNIIIKYKDLTYYLVDDKDIPEIGEFKHEKDEAPEFVEKGEPINA